MTEFIRTELAHLEVRRANKDIASFVDLIAQQLLENTKQIIDLSEHSEHGNRIPIQICRQTEVETA